VERLAAKQLGMSQSVCVYFFLAMKILTNIFFLFCFNYLRDFSQMFLSFFNRSPQKHLVRDWVSELNGIRDSLREQIQVFIRLSLNWLHALQKRRPRYKDLARTAPINSVNSGAFFKNSRVFINHSGIRHL